MSVSSKFSGPRWFAVQTLSNQEAKVKRYIEKFSEIEALQDVVFEVLMPVETVTEIKNGKKLQKLKKFYPGYIFVHMSLYDDEDKILQKAWSFVRNIEGVIGFVGGDKPTPLKDVDIQRIMGQVKESKEREVPKLCFELGQQVKITDGPFLNLTGRIDDIDAERGRLKVSVSIFGRFTPVELEYWQVARIED